MSGPRRVFLEGKFVGEVPDTGDLPADLKAMAALVKARGAPPLNRCQAAFRQAAAFAMNAASLFNGGLIGVPPPNPINIIPFAVNAAFAVELYLKTIGCLHGLQKMHGHDLLDLFDELPAEAHQRLSEEIAKVPATDPIKDLVGFKAEIERIRHVFMEWRYLYERSSATQIKFVEFTRVLSILHNTCRNDDRLKQVAG